MKDYLEEQENLNTKDLLSISRKVADIFDEIECNYVVLSITPISSDPLIMLTDLENNEALELIKETKEESEQHFEGEKDPVDELMKISDLMNLNDLLLKGSETLTGERIFLTTIISFPPDKIRVVSNYKDLELLQEVLRLAERHTIHRSLHSPEVPETIQ